jgi:phage-related protein
MRKSSGILPLPEAPLLQKPVRFLGSSRQDLRDMSAEIRHAIGGQLMRLQLGRMPADFKPMASVGAGAHEIRVRDSSGAFRAVYVAKFADAVYVLHVFQKKSRKTAKADLALARQRYELIPGARP